MINFMSLDKDIYIKNIKRVNLFSYFWMFLVIMPVVVPYFTSLGLSMEQIFKLQAIFGFTVAVCEVPSGYLCDLFGRKMTLSIGSFLSALGFTWLVSMDSFTELVYYEIVIGVAASLVSGTNISILYDSLSHIGDDRGLRTKAMANMQMAHMGGESTASIIGGLLVSISFKAVVIAHAITSWFPFIVSLTLYEPPYKKMDKNQHVKNMKEILFHLFKSDKLILLIFLNLVVWGLSSFIAVWIFQKYWQSENIPLAYFGLLWAGYNFFVGIVGKQIHFLEKRFGPTVLLVGLALLPVAGYFGMAYFSGWLGITVGLCFQASRGITNILLRDAFNWRIPSQFRATANSLTSLAFRFGFCLVGPFVGYMVDKKGLSISLQYIGLVFAILFVALMIPLILEVRKLDSNSLGKNC